MDSPVIKKKRRLDSSSRSSISLSPTDSKVDSGPSHKDVVLALAPFVCTEIKKNAKGKDIEYVVRECPNRKYCRNEGGLIRYQNKSGYKNPHLHLRTCVAKVSFIGIIFLALTSFIQQGDEGALLEMYRKTINRKTLQSKMGSHVNRCSVFVPTKRDVEVFELISMVLRKNLPLSIVEDDDWR